MTETMAEPRATRARSTAPIYAIAAVVSLAVTVPMLHHLEDLPRGEFAVENATAWNLTLHVRSAGAVSPLATLGAETERRLEEVIVPGATWVFVWRFTGEDVGTSTVTNEQLEQDDFVLRPPEVTARTLRSRGVVPSP